MHIIHVSSELAPIAKVGGLGDVLLGLSRELTREGHDVDIILPKYDCMDIEKIRDLHIYETDIVIEYDKEDYPNTIWMGWVDNLKVYFIEPHHPKLFFNRGCIYGCDDDIDRFLYFSKASLDLLKKRGLKPQVLHLHDWHTAIIAPLYRDLCQNDNGKKLVFTIHNLEYQGKCLALDIDKVGLKGADYAEPDKLMDENDPTRLNIMKGGIVYSDAVTTVSCTYAKEIQTDEGGKGLGQLLRKNGRKVYGIINGVDYSYWNPETDPYLPIHYSPREKPLDDGDLATIDRKAYIKQLLRKKVMLDEVHRPLVGCVARLVPQKGVELMRHALYRTLEKGGQFILLGTSPIAKINREFHEIMHHFADHPHAHLILKHDEESAHLIYAASDIFIVPSVFEPCGLTQMISMKYGTVPIVRKTGGLADTVVDADDQSVPFEKRNGFVFESPTPQGFNSALDRAIACWFENPLEWRRLMLNGMAMDFSWKGPAKQYLTLYKIPSAFT